MNKKYEVVVDGNVVALLNERLAIRQKVTPEQLEQLKETHVIVYHLKEAAKKTTDPVKLRRLAAEFDEIETEQQLLWNFEPDPNFHRFFDFPGCTCPKIDNAERLGTPYKVINNSCPIHGGSEHD